MMAIVTAVGQGSTPGDLMPNEFSQDSVLDPSLLQLHEELVDAQNEISGQAKTLDGLLAEMSNLETKYRERSHFRNAIGGSNFLDRLGTEATLKDGTPEPNSAAIENQSGPPELGEGASKIRGDLATGSTRQLPNEDFVAPRTKTHQSATWLDSVWKPEEDGAALRAEETRRSSTWLDSARKPAVDAPAREHKRARADKIRGAAQKVSGRRFVLHRTNEAHKPTQFSAKLPTSHAAFHHQTHPDGASREKLKTHPDGASREKLKRMSRHAGAVPHHEHSDAASAHKEHKSAKHVAAEGHVVSNVNSPHKKGHGFLHSHTSSTRDLDQVKMAAARSAGQSKQRSRQPSTSVTRDAPIAASHTKAHAHMSKSHAKKSKHKLTHLSSSHRQMSKLSKSKLKHKLNDQDRSEDVNEMGQDDRSSGEEGAVEQSVMDESVNSDNSLAYQVVPYLGLVCSLIVQ